MFLYLLIDKSNRKCIILGHVHILSAGCITWHGVTRVQFRGMIKYKHDACWCKANSLLLLLNNSNDLREFKLFARFGKLLPLQCLTYLFHCCCENLRGLEMFCFSVGSVGPRYEGSYSQALLKVNHCLKFSENFYRHV